MNKPELVKRLATEFCYWKRCGSVARRGGSLGESEQAGEFKIALHPDEYEKYISEAEVFVEELINKGLIDSA